MLEFLFSFIEKNIILIFLCVLILGVASAYSKSTKILFLFILGASAAYFALLCLYRLGIGIEFLYDWSCKWVITLCNQIDYYSIFCLNNSILLHKLMQFILARSFSDYALVFLHITLFFTLIFIIIDVVIPRLKLIIFKKLYIDMNKVNKNLFFTNTINRTQPKYILNSVFRC